MEQKAAHTPAPWHFKKLAMHDDDGGHVVMFTAQNGQRTHRLDCAGEFKEADARLIAAAPELLAALETAYMALIGYLPAHRNDVTDAAIGAARAAITKAKGGAA